MLVRGVCVGQVLRTRRSLSRVPPRSRLGQWNVIARLRNSRGNSPIRGDHHARFQRAGDDIACSPDMLVRGICFHESRRVATVLDNGMSLPDCKAVVAISPVRGDHHARFQRAGDDMVELLHSGLPNISFVIARLVRLGRTRLGNPETRL